MKELKEDLWRLANLGGKLRENDTKYREDIPFEYRPILNRLGKVIDQLATEMLKVLRKDKEKNRINFARKLSKIYDIVSGGDK